MNAFAYCRCSGMGQITGDSFPRQRVTIERFASANGYTILQTFEERGISGKTELDGREALQEMLEAMRNQGVRAVIIERLDRLARDLMVQETIIGDFRKRGFEIVSAAEPDLCSNDPTRVLMRQIFGAISQYDRAMICAKLKAARDRLKAKGIRMEGRKPFGVREGESVTLDLIRALDSNGLSSESIALELNSSGTLSRSGRPWRGSTIRRILKRGDDNAAA